MKESEVRKEAERKYGMTQEEIEAEEKAKEEEKLK